MSVTHVNSVLYRLLTTFLFFSVSWMLLSQHTPAIINYKVSEYKAHNQNWSVSQSGDGCIYFGNTDGLLSFNGNEWHLNKLESNKIIRSVCVANNKIYSGAHGEFGCWTKNECGEYNYSSLTSLVPDGAIKNEEIWNIVEYNGLIYFQSFSVLLMYDGKKIENISLPGSIMFLHKTNGKLLIQSIGYGIYEIKGTTSNLIVGSEYFNNKIVTGIIHLATQKDSERMVIFTNSHGVFTLSNTKISAWNNTFMDYFTEVQVNKMLVTAKGNVVLGTIRDGILIFDTLGNYLYHIHTENGLQNNTVLAMAEDQQHNIWLGLDKGVCAVNMNEDMLFYNDVSGKLGTVYSLAKNNNILYVGTNQGVYYYDQLKNKSAQFTDFKIIKGTQGQVWQLKKIDNEIICGHNEGTFIINGLQARKISDITGGWITEMVKVDGKDMLMQGTYTGLIIFKQINGNWTFSHRIADFYEPVKKFVIDSSGIWVTGPNSGLTLLKVNKDYTKVYVATNYNTDYGLSGAQNLDLSEIEGSLVINDGTNLYRYDQEDKLFKPRDFHKNKSNYLIRNPEGTSAWFKLYSDSFSLIQENNTIATFPLSLNKDYHSITKLDEHNYGVCLSEGYAVLKDTISQKSDHNNHLMISKIILTSKGECIPLTGRLITRIRYKDRQFKVFFNDANFNVNKQFLYRITPGNVNWNPTTSPYFIECNNLSAGNYTLEIRGSNHVSAAFAFEILAPWYLSSIAMMIYFLTGIGCIYLLKIYFDKKLNVAKEKLEKENERVLREHKISLENDRLVQDNLFKSKELANATMHLVQKNELLQEIKEELIEVRKKQDHTFTAKDFQTIMHQINDNLTIQEDKKLFDANFEDVHASFFKKLKTTYPELSGDDLKLAAYLKMNLSSKEIAPLFNISIRGLENKRYRLRKKINLPNEFSLTSFFVNYNDGTNDFT